MTKRTLIIKLDDLLDELKYGEVEGANEDTIEDVIYAIENAITTLKNDEG